MSVDRAALEAEKASLEAELALASEQAQKELLDGVSRQRWWFFKDKTDIAYDSHFGMLIPNLDVITLKNTSDKVKHYGDLGGISKESWKKATTEYLASLADDFPWPEKLTVRFISYEGEVVVPRRSNNQSVMSELSWMTRPSESMILNVCAVCANKNLHPKVRNFSASEKAALVLEFFRNQGWQPIFNNSRCQQIYYAEFKKSEYQERLQKVVALLKELLAQKQLAAKPSLLSSTFDYRKLLANYDAKAIDASVWQFARATQQWTKQLLALLDEWSAQKQDILTTAQAINAALAEKLPLAQGLTEAEQSVLHARRTELQTRLNFTLEPLRSALMGFRQQAVDLEKVLKGLNGRPDSIALLTRVAQQPRPSFELLAEHTATLCMDTLQQLEWLEENQEVASKLVAEEKKWAAHYTVFIDKYQQDLYAQASHNNVERSEAQTWFGEWRRERLLLEQQWLPLAQAGLDKTLTPQTVLAVIDTLAQYQQALDKFYVDDRLGVHTKFAFIANGHRQEKLEKELELSKLSGRFMQQLQSHIFATGSSAEKIWLVRWADVWLRDNAEQVLNFLQNEHLLERGEISQLILTEMRQLQQRTLEACLQDAQHYSDALKKRDADYNSLMFKMRKELQKGQS
jgi:hypothetical protein